ncbi:hypothetical protein Ga0466249_002807 [Sporomusaceae bacterium BoRhaA]|uniref:phage tail assembly protein n=1 Tax=Pelorhabdus rhamnosifermentans TaxID=2772457 RepID=UPI001C0624B3|nr:phage tail assembly protein [Pelorhabdus rhamnosifermentans]MBU2701688.1 hypothetical protein [Pelorhabdus rhamnosifermentans]
MKLAKPITKDGTEITELNLDFDKITGNQIIAAEKEARMLGDTTPDACYSKTFQAVIAAKAADQPLIVDDILAMNGMDFINITTQAANFLFGWALPGARANS